MNPIDLGFKSFILFLLIFARLMGIFVQAPLFGRPTGVPVPAQVGYGLAISLVIFHVLPLPAHLPTGLIPMFFMVAGQVAVGLMIGFTSYMVAAGVQFAGELTDIQLGLSVAASFDPASGGNVNLMRQFEFRLALLIWILIHGDHFFLEAVRRSYDLIPPDTFAINLSALNKLIQVSGGIFITALEISAPVLAALFITDVALGLLNRAAQQFNVFMLSFPLKILVGMIVLILSLSPLLFQAVPILWDHLNYDLMELIMALKK
jgi:flagellar biosynthetic protein FliR